MRLFTIILLFLVCACQEEKIMQVGMKGTLAGKVRKVIDYEALADVKVTINGAKEEIFLVTDSEGSYVVNDLPTGTYNLSYEKPGFGTYRVMGYPFVAGVEAPALHVTLSELPVARIQNLDVIIVKEPVKTRIKGTFTLADGPSYGYFRYYLSDEADVSPLKYGESGILNHYLAGGSFSFTLDLNTHRFAPGSRVYLVIYPTGDHNTHYIDLETGKKIYVNVAAEGSDVLSLDVPL